MVVMDEDRVPVAQGLCQLSQHGFRLLRADNTECNAHGGHAPLACGWPGPSTERSNFNSDGLAT